MTHQHPRLTSLSGDRLSIDLDLLHDRIEQDLPGPADRTHYVCPGESVAIPRAVHLARLHAAWSGCDECQWRTDTEGLSHQSLKMVDQIQRSRVDGILRTEFGVRGQYINHLTRAITAGLVQVFCDCLIRADAALAESTSARGRGSVLEDPEPRRIISPSVITGYDGRSCSPDLYVGVTTAICEFGVPVIDIGRCTAASALEAVRTMREAAGAVVVTGAGAPPSHAGLDVFDRRGESIPVLWKDYGIQLRARVAEISGGGQPDRKTAESGRHAFLGSEAPASQVCLCLPDRFAASGAVRRQSRRSGVLRTVDFESQYREWLLRWYPVGRHTRVVVRTPDSLIVERLRWLETRTGIELICRSVSDRSPAERFSEPDRVLTITVQEDDRSFQLASAAGQNVPYSQLAALLNRRMTAHNLHVTAHGDDAGQRFWLTDMARPAASRSTEQIFDSLAVLGLLLKCDQD